MRAMALRCLVTFLLLALIGQVSLQDFVKIDSVIGEDVNLPCLNENQQEITNVLWRYRVSRKVLNIVNGKSSSENQDKIFWNQVESFPSEYEKGNYSIKLKDVEMIHAGNYTCFLQKTNHEKMVQLVVKEKPKEKELKPNEPQQRTNSSMEAQPQKILTFLIALLAFLCTLSELE